MHLIHAIQRNITWTQIPIYIVCGGIWKPQAIKMCEKVQSKIPCGTSSHSYFHTTQLFTAADWEAGVGLNDKSFFFFLSKQRWFCRGAIPLSARACPYMELSGFRHSSRNKNTDPSSLRHHNILSSLITHWQSGEGCCEEAFQMTI